METRRHSRGHCCRRKMFLGKGQFPKTPERLRQHDAHIVQAPPQHPFKLDIPSNRSLGCREEGLTQSQTLSPQQSSLLGFTCDSEGCGNGGAICNVAVTAIGAGKFVCAGWTDLRYMVGRVPALTERRRSECTGVPAHWELCQLDEIDAEHLVAGMLALPKAMERVGVILGFTLFGTVCLLTYFSSSIIIRLVCALW